MQHPLRQIPHRPILHRITATALVIVVLTFLIARGVGTATPLVPRARAADPAPAPALVLGVGDSLMAGVGASLPDERGEFALFLALARGRFGPDVRGVDVAVPGETSGTLLAPPPPHPVGAGTPTPVPAPPATPQIDNAQAELRRLPAGAGAIVLLSIGGNDLLGVAGKDAGARETALGVFRANLDTALQRLTADGRTRQLLVQTIYNPNGGDPALPGSDANWVERFNGAIRDAAKAHPEVVVIDLASAVRGNEGALTLAAYGDVHLSNAGHRRAADLLWTETGADRTPPDVTLLSPDAGNAARAVLTVRATVTDDSGPDGVARVALLVDGKEGAELLPRPDLAPGTYLGIWDGRLTPGPHTVGVRATDRAGNTRDAAVNVTVGAAV